MRISHRYRFIFFASPKTGSESVRALLDPYSDIQSTVYLERTRENPFYSHMAPREAREVFEDRGWPFAEYRKFVFVRNPWARLVSLYQMVRRNQRFAPPFGLWLWRSRPSGRGGGGKDWQRWRKYGTYSLSSYVTDESGEVLVDRVFRLDDIDRELVPYLRSLGLPGLDDREIPRINVHNHIDTYVDWYSKPTRDLVARRYRDEIEAYGFRFGG